MSVERYRDLPKLIYKAFDKLSDEAYADFVKADYKSSFEKYEQCLAMIPEPKKEYGDASCVMEWMIENYLVIQDYHNAKKWIDELEGYVKNRAIMGDFEFLKGRVYFESGDLDIAYENFKIAKEKTKGRCFKEQDKKYIDFFRGYGM